MKNSSGGGRRSCAKTAPTFNVYSSFGGQQPAETTAAAVANTGDFEIDNEGTLHLPQIPILFPPLIQLQQQQQQQQLDAAAAGMDTSSMTSTSEDTSSELSSFAASGVSVRSLPPPASASLPVGGEGGRGGSLQARRQPIKRPDSPRIIPQAVDGGVRISDTSSSGSSGASSSTSFDCQSGCFSVPESEVHWSDLRALKPLINPSRLQALRLCTRDQHHSRIHDGGDATIMARPTSPHGRTRRQQQQQHRLETGTYQSQHTLPYSFHPRMSSPNASQTAISTAGAATANSMASSGNDLTRQAVYQYSFRIPDTKSNMRAFSDTGDRRVEAIARTCQSEVSLDPEPIRVARSSLRLRRVTIRAPDPHSLERCCRMFDDKFPHFYVSGGLGPGGRCVSKVYDDGDERYITMSQDEWS